MGGGSDCAWYDPVCNLTSAVTNSFLDDLASAVYQFYGNALASLGSVWIRVPTVDLTSGGAAPSGSTPPDEATAGIFEILGYVKWITLVMAVLALIAIGVLVGMKLRKGEGIAAVGRLGIVLGSVVLVAGATSLVSAVIPAGPSGVSGTVGFLQGSLWWYTLVGAVLSVFIGAGRMIWEQRADPGRELMKSLLQLVVVAGAGVTIVGILVNAADAFSIWVLDSSLDCDINAETCFGNAMGGMLQIAGTMPAGQIAVIVLGIFAIIASMIQMALMFVRSAMLVLLVGVLPLTASATNTEAGRGWFKKASGWLIAFILYKPVAALVYAAAFQMVGQGGGATVNGEDLFQVAQGLVLMFLALFALPALMRFVSPMVAGLASGASAGAAAGAVAASVPTGAISSGRGGGGTSTGSASGSSSGASGSSGSDGQQGSAGGTGASTPSSASPAAAPSAGAGAAGSGGAGAAGAGGAGAAGAGGAGAAGAGAGAGAAGAGAAAGPVGVAAGAALQAAQKGIAAAQKGAENAAGDGGGPSGSS